MLSDLRHGLAQRSQRWHRVRMDDGSCRRSFGLALEELRLELPVAVDDLFVELWVTGCAEAVQKRCPRVYAGHGFGAEVVQIWNSGVVWVVVVVEHEHAGGS